MPYSSEHAARVKNPDSFQKEGEWGRHEIAPGIIRLAGKLKSTGEWETQAYRFKTSKFTPEEARKWLKEHNIDYISFEKASEEKSNSTEISLINETEENVKEYKCRFIEPGLINYEDLGAGLALVKKEALDNMAKTFNGKPVLLYHTDEKINATNFSKKSLGIVSNVTFNPQDNWYYCNFFVWDKKLQNMIEDKKMSVSCSYVPTDTLTKGGVHNNINYDLEILNGEYTHLAIVDNPRYNGAKILLNSNIGGKMKDEIKKKLESIISFANDVTNWLNPKAKEEKTNEMREEPEKKETITEEKKREAKEEKENQMGEGTRDMIQKISDQLASLSQALLEHIKEEGEEEKEEAMPSAETKSEEKKEEEKTQMSNSSESSENENGKKKFEELQNKSQERNAQVKMEIDCRETRLERGKQKY